MPDNTDYLKKFFERPQYYTHEIYNTLTTNFSPELLWKSFVNTLSNYKYIGKEWWQKKTPQNFSPQAYLKTPAVYSALVDYYNPNISDFERRTLKQYLNLYRINPEEYAPAKSKLPAGTTLAEKIKNGPQQSNPNPQNRRTT